MPPIPGHDRPLQTPGTIQPHGVLIVLNVPDLEILQLSDNTQAWFGIAPEALLGRRIQCLLAPGQTVEPLQAFLSSVASSHLNQIHAVKLRLKIETDDPLQGDRPHTILLHRTLDKLILEIEPNPATSFSGIDLNNLVRGAFGSAVSQSTVSRTGASPCRTFLQRIAQEVQTLIQFDRVMVYQFDAAGSGEVVAEAVMGDRPTYLGLRYPATDIPPDSRALYHHMGIRSIPAITAEPIGLVPPDQSEIALDMSRMTLRAVDPCCVTFHQNMGVAALLVLPLMQDEQLWGLISCHHYCSTLVTYELRSALELLAQMVSLELTNQIHQQDMQYRTQLQTVRSHFVEAIAHTESADLQTVRDVLLQPEPLLSNIVSAAGAAVCLGDEISLIGNTPEIATIRALIKWADPKVENSIFATNTLPKDLLDSLIDPLVDRSLDLLEQTLQPLTKSSGRLENSSENSSNSSDVDPATLLPAELKETASGLLLLRISRAQHYYILWFRPELIQTINWAGNPGDSIQTNPDGSLELSPRNSFELWQEIVQMTAAPWQTCELESAMDLRNAIVSIVLNKADELAQINQELQRRNQELDSFAYAASHDLKEPLRGIYNYSQIVLEDYGHLLDAEAIDYLQSVISLSQRMDVLISVLLQFSQLGQTALLIQQTDLNVILNRLVQMFHASRPDVSLDVRIPRSLPLLSCDPILVNELFSNLISNAFKYNNKSEPWVEIGYLTGAVKGEGSQAAAAPFVFYVKDNGIGIAAHHQDKVFRLFKRLHSQDRYGGGAGAGLAIAKKIIERHEGRIWLESILGEGTTFYFTLSSPCQNRN